MTHRTLIFGASWCPDDEKRELCKLWAKVLRRTSPTCDLLVIDCDSPFRPGAFLRDDEFGFTTCTTPIDDWREDTVAGLMFAPYEGRQPIRVAVSFKDNIGHLSLGGDDGWGRSFCKGLEIAQAGGYDYVAYIEPDLIFAPPVVPIVEKMARAGVKVAAPMDCMYGFIANEIMFFDVAWLRASGFVERYDWQHPPTPITPQTIPEMRCERAAGDDLFILPIRTVRNDFHNVTPENLSSAFPYGLDALTHCKNFAVYEAFLTLKGMGDLVEVRND